MIVRTDRKDARGIAQLLRMGWYRPVHRKSPPAQEVRALLVGRKLLQGKLVDVELGIRGILRGFGLKVGEVSRGRFAARVEGLAAGHEMLGTVIGAMLQARDGLRAEFVRLHRRMLAIVRDDAVCRRLMTAPGVGALVAVTFKTAVDDPGRFRTAKAVGAHFGLTPKRYQSGETDVTGGISKVGDAMAHPVDVRPLAAALGRGRAVVDALAQGGPARLAGVRRLRRVPVLHRGRHDGDREPVPLGVDQRLVAVRCREHAVDLVEPVARKALAVLVEGERRPVPVGIAARQLVEAHVLRQLRRARHLGLHLLRGYHLAELALQHDLLPRRLRLRGEQGRAEERW